MTSIKFTGKLFLGFVLNQDFVSEIPNYVKRDEDNGASQEADTSTGNMWESQRNEIVVARALMTLLREGSWGWRWRWE